MSNVEKVENVENVERDPSSEGQKELGSQPPSPTKDARGMGGKG